MATITRKKYYCASCAAKAKGTNPIGDWSDVSDGRKWTCGRFIETWLDDQLREASTLSGCGTPAVCLLQRQEPHELFQTFGGSAFP